MPKSVNAYALDLNTDSDSSDGGPHQVKQFDDKDEFRDTKFKDLVMSEGPQQILQLIL
jgi:hypothetical protein